MILYDLAGSDPELRFSPFCWRVRMALAHKGVEPDTVPWRFHERDRLPGSPRNQQVPVVVDGSRVVAGSTSIAFHLEERHPTGPSLFNGAGGEAHVHFILAWVDAVMLPRLLPIAAANVLPVLHEADQEYFRETRERRLGMTLEQARAESEERLPDFQHSLEPLRVTLDQQDFLGGDEPSYADYGVFGGFQWARCIGAPEVLAEDDPIRSWRETMLDLFDGLARQAVVARDSEPALSGADDA